MIVCLLVRAFKTYKKKRYEGPATRLGPPFNPTGVTMSDQTEPTTLETIFLQAGITGALETVIRTLDDEFRFSEAPHQFTWVEWIEDDRGVRYVQFADGRIGLPAFEFAHSPALGQDFVVAIFPNTDDAKLNERIPVRIVPVGIVPTRVRRVAEKLITTHFGQTVEIPGLDETVWDESALTRHDITVDLSFREFEIRGGKRKGQTRVGSSMPSGKRVELFGGGRAKRFGSKTPPLGVSVRCLVKFERLSKVLVVWTGKTTAEAEAEATRVAPLTRILQTSRIEAETRPALADPFVALGINPENATFRDARQAARTLLEVEIATDDAALADPMACAMMTAGYSFKPGDPKSTRARSEYIEDGKVAAIEAIRRRDEAKARKPAAAEAPAAAEGGVPSNGGYEKPFGPRMGIKRLLGVAAELGIELSDEEKADKPAILVRLEAHWAATHPAA